MPDRSTDAEREARIDNEILVETYDIFEERAGWHVYASDRIDGPVPAVHSPDGTPPKRDANGLPQGDRVVIDSLGEEDECCDELCAWISREGGDPDDLELVPLTQLWPIDPEDEANQAIEDWRYWYAKHGPWEDEGFEDF